MAARLVFVLSVFTLGLWSHVTASMQMRSSEDDVSDVSATRDDSTVDLPSLYRLEQYLYDVRNKLDRARQEYGREEEDDELRPEPEVDYRTVTSTKRKAPFSGFYSARGRRTQALVTSQDGASQGQGQGQGDTLRLLDYYRAMHEKRTPSGGFLPTPLKRQPPRGFHAVRGRRAAAR